VFVSIFRNAGERVAHPPDFLGTVTHEIGHLNTPDDTDTDFQAKLGIDQNESDSTNISRKLGKDCFKGAKPPKP